MNRFFDTPASMESHAWLVHIRMQDAEHAAQVHRSIRRTSDRPRWVPWRGIAARRRASAA
jgi:hypothetical protein